MCKLPLTAGYPGLTDTARVPPNFCNGKCNGQYTNPADRNSFYNCWEGRTYIQKCQNDLVFNPKCSCCDYDGTQFTTKQKTTKRNVTPTTENTPNFCKGKISGLYPNPANPRSFYKCANGIGYPQNCPSNLVFNQKCSCCDYPTDNFCKGKGNGQYTNPADRNSFYNCWEGRTYLQKCQNSLVFNQQCSCCDYDVTPSTTTQTPRTTTTTRRTKTTTRRTKTTTPRTTTTTRRTTTTNCRTTTTTPRTTTTTPPTTTTTPPTTTTTPPTTTTTPPTTTTTPPTTTTTPPTTTTTPPTTTTTPPTPTTTPPTTTRRNGCNGLCLG